MTKEHRLQQIKQYRYQIGRKRKHEDENDREMRMDWMWKVRSKVVMRYAYVKITPGQIQNEK